MIPTNIPKAQVYHQEPGACRPSGEVLEPGWYWVRVRANEADPALPPVPYGSEVGPFKTWRQAERDYEKTEARCTEQGQEGYVASLARIENPYRPGTARYIAWAKGWDAAYKADRQ